VIINLADKERINKFKHYFSASLLTTLAGVITFPVLTRILSKADYGIYSLIQGVQLIYEAILKCGGQLSVLRFYPEMMRGDEKIKHVYITNIFLLPLMFSLLITSLVIVAVVIYSMYVKQSYILILVAITAQSSIILSFYHSLMQASGKSKIDAIADILNKYLYLIFVIPTVMYLLSNYWGVYWSICIASLFTSCFVIYSNREVFHCISLNIDTDVIKRSMKYSFPLFLTEISAISMSYVDRFVMGFMDVDIELIGIYAIGMGLANVFFILIWKTVQPLVFPMINDIHDGGDVSGAMLKLSEATNFYILFVLSVLVGVFLNSSDFLIILSGYDKVEASIFFSLGLTILLFKLLGNFLFYGFELKKETGVIFRSELILAVTNLSLNILLIPILGMYGAVIASLVSIPLGMLYRFFKTTEQYTVLNPFDGLFGITILLVIYYFLHQYLIAGNFDSEFIRLLMSVLVFLTVFLLGKKVWFEKFNKVFSAY
jgi:O-antigen/teichoic acid export membrane protein